MDPNHLVIVISDNSDTVSNEFRAGVATTLSDSGSSTSGNNATAESNQWSHQVEVVATDEYSGQSWDEQLMGVILMVELRAPLDAADAWTLQSWTEQVTEALDFFIGKTRRAEQYLQKDEVFMNWVVDVVALWHRVSPTEQDEAWAEYQSYWNWVLRRPPSKIELRKIPVTSVRVDGLEERILFYQGPTSSSVVGRSDDVAVHPDDVTGVMNPAVQKLVRQGMLRSVDAFRVWDVELM